MATLDPFAQTRTSTGIVPCKNVAAVHMETETGEKALVALSFIPEDPTHISPLTHKPGRASMDLVDLGASATVRTTPNGPVTQVSADSLLSFAKKHGPLFARTPFAWNEEGDNPAAGELFEEDAGAWVSAASMANLAIVAQQLSQGRLPLVTAGDVIGNLVRWHVTTPEVPEDPGFDLLIVARPVTPEYADWLGAPLFIRREELSDRIDYSFLLRGDEQNGTAESGTWLEVVVASFVHEITAADYRLLSQALGFSESLDKEVRTRLSLNLEKDEQPRKPNASLIVGASHLADTNLLGKPQSIEEEGGSELLASLVRALVAAHLRDAYVDVFSASDETGFLSFRSYLSWLWYDFSSGIDKARIKYCVRCGRAFSVVGHRGPDRVFCSDECRNASHNERSNRRRDKLRHEFLEQNKTVQELARRYFPEEKKATGEKRVRQSLQSWPSLKHAVDDDIERNGWSSPLLQRCRNEKLSLSHLLTTKRRNHLERIRETVQDSQKTKAAHS